MNDRQQLRTFINLLESQKEQLDLIKLSFGINQLSPIMSKKTIELHYNILTKNYYKNANKTHDPFQIAGDKPQ